MPLKTPDFWYNNPRALTVQLLRPLSWLYRLGHFIHQKTGRPYKCGAPVICIGNIVAGGTGKTPASLSIMQLIKDHKLAETPFFLTRGYGGDEDKILSQHALTIVNADRAGGAREAEERGADLILMDDGLQNTSLHKDIKFVVIDGAMGFGNGYMLPAGPLRQPLKVGLESADAFILISDDTRNIQSALPDKPVFKAQFKAQKELSPTARYIAFAGLGYPEKFFAFLRNQLGERLVETRPFPDHHPYNARDLQGLRDRALALNATLITTEKDAARLSPADDDIEVMPVTLQWENEEGLITFLKNKVTPS